MDKRTKNVAIGKGTSDPELRVIIASVRYIQQCSIIDLATT